MKTTYLSRYHKDATDADMLKMIADKLDNLPDQWNPLEDSYQAFELMVWFRVRVDFAKSDKTGFAALCKTLGMGTNTVQYLGKNEEADTRRAIVTAIATEISTYG